MTIKGAEIINAAQAKMFADGNKLIGGFLGVPTKGFYRTTNMVDDNGKEILEGSVIIADGYGSDPEAYYCVEWYKGAFGSCAYRDFEPLSSYKSIVVKGHCSDYGYLVDSDSEWSGNLGEVYKQVADIDFHEDWAALMSVVDKIESLGYVVSIETDKTVLRSVDAVMHWNSVRLGSKRLACWNTVIQFVKWYNNENNIR